MAKVEDLRGVLCHGKITSFQLKIEVLRNSTRTKILRGFSLFETNLAYDKSPDKNHDQSVYKAASTKGPFTDKKQCTVRDEEKGLMG
jgi:hypothetical protein